MLNFSTLCSKFYFFSKIQCSWCEKEKFRFLSNENKSKFAKILTKWTNFIRSFSRISLNENFDGNSYFLLPTCIAKAQPIRIRHLYIDVDCAQLFFISLVFFQSLITNLNMVISWIDEYFTFSRSIEHEKNKLCTLSG